MKNILSIFKKFFSYKWCPNFLSTIFKNEKVETISDEGFAKIDYGCLTVSNSFFVKLCCSIIIVIFLNISINDLNLNIIMNVLSQNWFILIIYLLMEFVPKSIIYKVKKNRYVKRYPRFYYNMLILVLISLIEVIFSTIYFISKFSNSKVLIVTSVVGLIANMATFVGYLSISIGIIDFCIFTNKASLNKKIIEKTDFGDYVDYF